MDRSVHDARALQSEFDIPVLVAPILMIAIIFRTMEAFKTFDLAYILTSQPTTEVISIRLYKMAFQEWQTGRSCALAPPASPAQSASAARARWRRLTAPPVRARGAARPSTARACAPRP